MDSKPNILFFMCDQMQAKALNENMVTTPNMDYLREKGVTFERAYTPNAVCSPARASLMTGLLPHNHGVLRVTHAVDSDQATLREDKPHWAQSLVEANYKTGYFGKWHIERTNDLLKFGWQINGSFESGFFDDEQKEKKGLFNQEFLHAKYLDNHEGYYDRYPLYGVVEDPPEKREMGMVTNAALNFLEEKMNETDPWCCFVSYNEPHDPFIAGQEAFNDYNLDEIELPNSGDDLLIDKPNLYKKASGIWKDLNEKEKREVIACYYASITELDQQLGRLIKKLQEKGEMDNTVIILTSDHGEFLGAHGLYLKNISAFEEVYNIPLIMAGPGIAKGETTDARVGLHDLSQTILDLVNCEPFNIPDSRSFKPILSKPSDSGDFLEGYSEYFGGRIDLTQKIVWDDDWKYVFNGFDFDELYNLKEDPDEMDNLIDNPNFKFKVRELSAQMWKKVKETGDHSLLNTHYPILRVAPYGPLIVEEEKNKDISFNN